ncbi:MAG: preprotein translocase subunit SecG [Luteolibacter sp.]
MILADIPWLSLSINLLLVIFFLVCVMMVLLILMQRPKQEGLGATFGTNVTDQVFGARTTNVLQRGTVYLATAFFVLSLALAILIGHQNATKSLVNKKAVAAAEPEAPAAPVTPVVPETPAAPAETPAPAPAEAPKSEDAPKPETPAQPAAPVETPAKPAEPAPAEPANGGEKPAGQ